MKLVGHRSNFYLGGLVLLALLTIISGAAAQTQTTCVPPPSGRVSWLPGDGNANDIAGSNRGEQRNGAAFAAGKVGPAFSFDGVNDSILVEHSPSLNLNEHTIGAWVNPGVQQGAAFHGIVVKDKGESKMLTLRKFTGVTERTTHLVRQSLRWVARPMRLAALLFALSLLSGLALSSRPSQAQEASFQNILPADVSPPKIGLKGDVVIIGNTLLHCDPDNPGVNCDNNTQPQKYVNNSREEGTFNSSSATLTLPTGATIKWARLYWGATLHMNEKNKKEARLPQCGDASKTLKEGNNCTEGLKLRDKVKFRYPKADEADKYIDVDISGELIGPDNAKESYHSFANVTGLLTGIVGNAARPLTFTVANVQTARGIQRHAGWSLVIVYGEPPSSGAPFRNITVFQGYRKFLREARHWVEGELQNQNIQRRRFQ